MSIAVENGELRDQEITFSEINFLRTTLYNVCLVHLGMFSKLGGVQSIGQYREYIGECSVHRRDITIHVGNIMSIWGYQYIGGIP